MNQDNSDQKNKNLFKTLLGMGLFFIIIIIIAIVIYITIYRYSLIGKAIGAEDYTTALALGSPELSTISSHVLKNLL